MGELSCPNCSHDMKELYFKLRQDSRRELVRKVSRCAIDKLILGSLREFRRAHPDALDGKFQNSLQKRMTGNIFAYLSSHEKIKNIVKEVEK